MTSAKILFGLTIIALSIFTSCGTGSIENDAKRLAELQCKAQKLSQKAASGDISIMGDYTKLISEASALSAELEGKYTSDSEKEKFGKALLQEMGKCN